MPSSHRSQFLDPEVVSALDPTQFRSTRPYPWVNPRGLLTDAGYRELIETLPEVSMFESQFGLQRSHGQAPHDRYSLFYRESLKVSEAWHEFVAELQADDYRRFLSRMIGRRPKRLSFYWQYAPAGAGVSPHCDAKRKLGSHIFYLNTESDWDASWGGETLILDDGGAFPRESAPTFEQFPRAFPTQSLGNRSLLFARRESSWHGVRPLRCPLGYLRKIFLVVIDDAILGFARRALAPLTGKRVIDY